MEVVAIVGFVTGEGKVCKSGGVYVVAKVTVIVTAEGLITQNLIYKDGQMMGDGGSYTEGRSSLYPSH